MEYETATDHPTEKCRVCQSSMPRGAVFCIKCEQWQDPLWLLRLKRLALPIVAALATALVPLALEIHSALDRASERDSQIVAALSTALQGTVSVTSSLREAEHALMTSCRPAAWTVPDQTSTTQRAPRCELQYLLAMLDIDKVMSAIAWTIDSAPVTSDTYARNNNLKERFWRSCTNEKELNACGYRQKLVRFLHAGDTSGQPEKHIAALKHCDSDVVSAQACDNAIGRVREQVFSPLRIEITLLLCAVTRDANELRLDTWHDNALASSAMPMKALRARLRNNEAHSDCARMLAQAKISKDCSYGKGTDGECLTDIRRVARRNRSGAHAPIDRGIGDSSTESSAPRVP